MRLVAVKSCPPEVSKSETKLRFPDSVVTNVSLDNFQRQLEDDRIKLSIDARIADVRRRLALLVLVAIIDVNVKGMPVIAIKLIDVNANTA
jgi:hypothetical protein